MLELREDYWLVAGALPRNSAICVTTNGCVKRNGLAVMGAGIAKSFAQRFPDAPRLLAQSLSQYGLHTKVFGQGYVSTLVDLVSLPTKLGPVQMTSELRHLIPAGKVFPNGSWVDGWALNSPPDLVLRSCRELVSLADEHDWARVLLTRPGCGNGGLSWDELRPQLQELFDHRFVIVHK